MKKPGGWGPVMVNQTVSPTKVPSPADSG